MSLFEELKRRNVFRVGIAYVLLDWVVLQAVDFALDLTDAPNWIIQVFFIAGLAGLPVVLFLAWAFEITPEGLKRESEVDRSASITPQTGRRLDRAIIVFLVLIVVGMGVERFYPQGPDGEPAPATEGAGRSDSIATEAPAASLAGTEQGAGPGADPASPTGTLAGPDAGAGEEAPRRPSVAVLPFVAMSRGEDDEYFADGLTEEILNSLAQLPELLVTARTSSFHFKGQDLPVPEIARRLGVDHVVEGSVRRAGEQVRITAQLIRAADGFHLWSRTYDRTLENVFQVQEDIAASIAETLDVVLDETKLERMRAAGIGDVDAFIAYQRGVASFNQAHEDIDNVAENLGESVLFFERALAVAPNLVAARILKADAAAHVVFNLAANFRAEAFEGEADEALRALREEFDLAWRNSPPGPQRDILDAERGIFEDDWSDLPGRLSGALEPGNCTSLNWTLELAAAVGQAKKALQKTIEEARCDPLNPLNAFQATVLKLWNQDPQGAREEIRISSERGVHFGWLEDTEMFVHLALDDLDHPSVQRKGRGTSWVLYPRELLLQARSGDVETARATADAYGNRSGTDDWSALVASAIAGDREAANARAARIDARPGGVLVLVNSIYSCLCGAPFDLEATPNFRARMEEAGFPWPPRAAIDYRTRDW